jgi:phosphoserine phosphatase
MKKFTIIWDFDGTILPITPFDSEQTLLIHRMARSREIFVFFKKVYAWAIIYADRRERLRQTFKRSYIRLLKGTPSAVLDQVCRRLAGKISMADREALRQLKNDGHDMKILSCGTADLSERILNFAELTDCFSLVEGNRFQFVRDQIAGMDLRLPNPQDKLAMMAKLKLSPEHTIVVGDGYTDLPLLDWTRLPIMIDRTGQKINRQRSKTYHFISSIPEVLEIIDAQTAQMNGTIPAYTDEK